MANVAWGKKILAVAVLGCLCALIAVPAYAFYYVHDEEGASQSGQGVIEGTCTIDATSIGEGVRTDLIILPEGSTAKDCLNEAIVSSNSQNGLSAIHDYSTTSLKDYLSEKQWSCAVFEAGSQKPGTHTTYDTLGSAEQGTPLNRFDCVVFTVA